jgi:hypothetical protein
MKEKTQKERLLELFQEKGILSNYELRSMVPAMFQYPVRIKELIEEGHPIIGYHDESDRRKYLYKYLHVQKDLFHVA